ncbi:hypothetical protein QYF61_019818 [Mycteria americana]|uniref:ribonuclease H n=1 Tax=Mycteria americana TaxID=33587 RepID=A0AAN7RNT3_MYCAM|nr:hypothetical protein QYF61_019817 [Mycteria americana]KAK4811187.1 hypothetical protein QYF61_019818 [Mycteria americana]
MSKQTVNIVGATGQVERAFFLRPLKFKIGKSVGIHKFLYLPEAPRPLLGRDLLEQLNAEIRFKDREIEFKIPEENHIEILSLVLTEPQVREEEIMQEIKDQVYPGVWASGIPGKAKNAELVVVKLKEGTRPIRVKQYPLKLEDRRGVKHIIDEFIKFGLLTECSSEYNTPILPVKKPDGKTYRLVQDLRAINRIVEDLHPVVANPYTLLTSLKETYEWFTVLDLKDAFFCLTLAPESRNFFAFEWENPDSGRKTQLTWTVLPQGFKNSPTIFGNQLAKELEVWERPPGNGTLLQYVDDILIATEKEEECKEWTVSLLNFLGLSGYRVSLQKVQILKKEVIYLGFVISKGQRQLGNDRKEAICRTPEPTTVKELNKQEMKTVVHDCIETIETVYASRPDLKDEPLEEADHTWYTDGSSFVKNGV